MQNTFDIFWQVDDFDEFFCLVFFIVLEEVFRCLVWEDEKQDSALDWYCNERESKHNWPNRISIGVASSKTEDKFEDAAEEHSTGNAHLTEST